MHEQRTQKPPHERSLGLFFREDRQAHRKDIWRFRKNDVDISVFSYEDGHPMLHPLEDQTLFSFLEGERLGWVAFTSAGRPEHVPEYKSLLYHNGIEGFDAFFQFLHTSDEARYPTPDYLVGRTNQRTAQFAKRLGFRIADETADMTNIVGDTVTVWEQFEKYRDAVEQNPELKARLHERAEQQKRLLRRRKATKVAAVVVPTAAATGALAAAFAYEPVPVMVLTGICGIYLGAETATREIIRFKARRKTGSF